MAEASRALARVSRLHGFRVKETHAPFAGEARRAVRARACRSRRDRRRSRRRRSSSQQRMHRLSRASSPSSTCMPASTASRIRSRGAVTVMSPLHETAVEWTLARAFDVARSSRARVTSVGGDVRWTWLFRSEAARHEGVQTEELDVGPAVQGLAFEPDRFDVVVAPTAFAEPLFGVARPRADIRGSRRRAASPASARASSRPRTVRRRRSPVRAWRTPPRCCSPRRSCSARASASDAPRRRSRARCSRRAATASARRTWSPRGVGATTREFGDVVIAELPSAMTNAEFYREAVA